MNLALSAASTRLRDIEAEVGTTLLVRSRSGVVPTPAGEALLAHARGLLAGAERMHEELSSYVGGTAGHVRLLSNTNALTEFLPDVLGRFLAAHPGTTVDVQERLSDEIVGMIAEGAAEIGIVLVASHSHALAKQTGVAFSDVLGEDFVGLDRASALQRFLANRATREGRRLRLRVQLRSFDAICRLVEAGVGVGIVPATTAHRAARTTAISIVPLLDAWAQRDLRVCLRSLTSLSVRARQLANMLAEGWAETTPD